MNPIIRVFKNLSASTLILLSLFFTGNSETIGKNPTFLNPFNSHPLNDFVKQMNDEVAKEDLPQFSKLLKDVKVESSYFNSDNVHDLLLLPVIRNDFNDAHIAFLVHDITYLLPVLKERFPGISFRTNSILSNSDSEFTYGEVNRIKPSREINVMFSREGKLVSSANVTSLIFHDGLCDFTKHLLVLDQPVKEMAKSESALLVLGSISDLKIKVEKLHTKKVKDATFWVADLDGDNIYDFIWGFDLNNGYNAYFDRFFSAYNLNGQWIPWRVLNAKHWDSGC